MAFKTLHLTNAWHETSGGIATFYRALTQEADRRGHPIRLVVPGEASRVVEAGEFARIYYVKAPAARFNSEYRMIYPSQYLKPGSPLQEILAAERPDLIEICDKYALNYLGALLREGMLRELSFRPIVVGLSCERMDDNFRTYIGRWTLSNTFCRAYMKWLYFPFFDHHIANSEYTAGELRDASHGHAVARGIWVLPMGVDLGHFSPERRTAQERRRLQHEIQANEKSVILIYAGRLAPEKHLALLFRTFERLLQSAERDYRLVIAGDGSERPRWEAFCATRFPGRAVFLGHLKSSERLADLLANADAFVHPNPHEPFGIAPLEAMASGLPLVAPDQGGVTTYASSENAWIASPDPESFASAVESLLGDGTEAARRVRVALRTAAEFSWDRAAAAYLDLYAEMHQAEVGRSDLSLNPASSSTPATGIQAAFARGMTRAAKTIFQLTTSYGPRPHPMSRAAAPK